MATELAFSTPLRFRCVEGCGLCCTYKVPVLAGETGFLRACGEAVVQDEAAGASLAPNVVGYLRRENGYCVLLDEDKRCNIYADRPIYCRLFPLVRDSYGHRQIDANFSCPGLGKGEPFAASDFEGVAELEATAADLEGWERRQRESYEFAVQMLRAKGSYCPEEVMRAAVVGLVDEALAAGASLDLGRRLREAVESSRATLVAAGNVEGPEELAHLFPHVSEAGGPSITPEERDLLREYLMLWARRNLTLRAAHAQALASLTPENVTYHFAGIVSQAAQEVCKAAGDSCEANRVADGVRQVDSSLRSRYMSARISFG